MKEFEAKRVYNGTWGSVYIDGYKLAEISSFSASVELETEDVGQAEALAPGKKTTAVKCEGTMKLHKVSPYFRDKCSDSFKSGQIPTATIVAGISDPDALQKERISIKDALFTKMTLMDFEVKKLGEEEIPFTFSDWEVLA